jgi:hypothetical protein
MVNRPLQNPLSIRACVQVRSQRTPWRDQCSTLRELAVGQHRGFWKCAIVQIELSCSLIACSPHFRPLFIFWV